jgi:hypothetical protein
VRRIGEGKTVSRDLQPVELVHELDHRFQRRAKRGCGVCGRAKTHITHAGAAPSLNVLGSGNQFAFQAHKRAWQDRLVELLERADLPRPLARVVAEGEVTFPDRIRRDQGNHRFMLEKALGDALTEGGWLPDDDWTRYEFGGLAARYERGVSRTRLMLFPTAAEDGAGAAVEADALQMALSGDRR